MFDLFWLGVAIAVVLCCTLLFLLLQTRQLRQQQTLLEEQKRVLETRIKSLETKLEFVTTGSKGIGQRLMTAEKKLNQALEKQDELLSNNKDALFQRQAERLLKQPLPADDDAALSRSEAKLMALVGGKPNDKS